MSTPYIDLHTHRRLSVLDTFELLNIIVGRDDYPASLPFSAGLHPRYLSSGLEQQFINLEHYLRNENALAIGECGLDKLCNTAWDLQIHAFQRQVLLAEKLNKPLLIHCVRAYQEVLHGLKKVHTTAIFHGFNKKIELAHQIIRQGHFLSMGADVLHGRLDDHIRLLPLEKIFLETDGKDVSIVDIYTYFCNVRKMKVDELCEQICQNFERVFKHVF